MIISCSVKIGEVRTINEIPGYWTRADHVALLEALDMTDMDNTSFSELQELLAMAISDREPHESAEVLLRYKLADKLNNGQIQNLSHVMIEDNEAEENPEIALHYPLFNINQLLYRSYNGLFTNGKATKVELVLHVKNDEDIAVTKELVLKAISGGLSDNNLILRLFEDQLSGKEKFSDAENIIWELHDHGSGKYAFITSDYWINREDIVHNDFVTTIKPFGDREA